MDLTTGWNFNLATHRDAAEEYVRTVKPWLRIGSPECKMFSQLQQLNKRRSGEKSDLSMQAKEHLKFVAKLYKIQWGEGRKFLHEHPAGATSWQLWMMQEVMKLEGVRTTIADQCMYGLKTWSTNRAIKHTLAPKKDKIDEEQRFHCQGIDENM